MSKVDNWDAQSVRSRWKTPRTGENAVASLCIFIDNCLVQVVKHGKTILQVNFATISATKTKKLVAWRLETSVWMCSEGPVRNLFISPLGLSDLAIYGNILSDIWHLHNPSGYRKRRMWMCFSILMLLQCPSPFDSYFHVYKFSKFTNILF